MKLIRFAALSTRKRKKPVRVKRTCDGKRANILRDYLLIDAIAGEQTFYIRKMFIQGVELQFILECRCGDPNIIGRGSGA
jgi:hypothetical protein